MNPPPLAVAAATVAVAYSGGRDSTALLHATVRAAVEQPGVQVIALHVHHGLQPAADSWLAHCERQCKAWQRKGWPVRLVHTLLSLRPVKGESVEAVARTARYAALARMAKEHGADCVLLAHHRRDQAETFLLQALRGAGVAGLAGMPAAAERDGLLWLRPWLARPREAIEAYVRRHRLRYVDDGSNQDVRFARNRLRHDVWPALSVAFPMAEASLADAAAWAGEASACLAELAEQDLHGLQQAGTLQVAPLLALSAPRGRNALRAWVRRVAGAPLSAALLERLWLELPSTSAGQWPLPGGGVLRSYRGALRYEADGQHRAVVSAVSKDASLSIRRAGRYRLRGWGGTLVVRRVAVGGVALSLPAQLQLRDRSGGEQFQSGPQRPARSLKKQFQAAGVPSWSRTGPLLYAGEQLLWVPGLGVDARAAAVAGEAQLAFEWIPD
ncbi:tRNA lysidine(34) synthetase TilS [Caldimonas brevitalea]|uniref:tRNA(Ile)-lysidine synthase n=1 Tax=Caldimonas brevitalea TaxID=413882 RepID=A0A0G3BMR8_9BURK|nr:tRNA lysidine(34) synthetase TilS [Caldimonas brevitalea]AKJ28671.1 tRNA(Ile)-lysidine synthase [Caldimonas brevitalea]